MIVRVERELTQEVPAEWRARLRAISPVSPVHSWLDFRWLPARKVHQTGAAEDRGRWVLYQWIPRAGIPAGIVAMLEDRPPRLLPQGQRIGREFLIDEYAHEHYRLHRVWVRPFWVIQGTQGGHPLSYTDREQEIRRAMGQPTEPPRIGALPYAPFDERVVRQVVARDRLRQVDGDLDRFRRQATPEAVQRELAEAELAFRAQYLAWMEEELAPSTAFLTDFSRTKAAEQTFRPATRAEENAAARLKDEYIATGLVPAA